MSARSTVKSIQDIMRQDVGVDGDAQRLSQLCWMFFLKIIDDQDQQLEVMDDEYRSPLPKRLQWRNWAADPEGITGDEMLEFGGGVIAFRNGVGDLRFHFLPEPLAEAVDGDFHRAFAHAESGGRIRL